MFRKLKLLFIQKLRNLSIYFFRMTHNLEFISLDADEHTYKKGEQKWQN